MHIVFSLGTHRDMTHEEMVEAVGEEVSSRLKMYNSTATKGRRLRILRHDEPRHAGVDQ